MSFTLSEIVCACTDVQSHNNTINRLRRFIAPPFLIVLTSIGFLSASSAYSLCLGVDFFSGTLAAEAQSTQRIRTENFKLHKTIDRSTRECDPVSRARLRPPTASPIARHRLQSTGVIAPALFRTRWPRSHTDPAA